MAINSDRELRGLSTAELKSVHEDSFGNDYNIKEAFGLNKSEYRNNGADATRKRPTRRQAKKDLEKTFGVYKNEKADNWRKVADEMGIKDVNSNSDFAALRRKVSQEYGSRKIDGETSKLNKRITDLENRPAATADSEDKPKGDMVIDSPEVTRGKIRVENYEERMEGYQNSGPGIFDGTPDSNKQGNSFDESTTADTPAKDPQAFADQYKLDLINSGATQQQPNDQPPKLTAPGQGGSSSGDPINVTFIEAKGPKSPTPKEYPNLTQFLPINYDR